MFQATVSPKYQVVIPREIREEMHIKVGSKLAVMRIGQMIQMFPQPELRSARGLLSGRSIDNYRDRSDLETGC